MATMVQHEPSQGYIQQQNPAFNPSENENFNFTGFLDQVNFLEQNKMEMMDNRMLYRNENYEQGGSLDGQEMSYQIRVNDSFNNGTQDHSYHEYSGYSHDLSGFNQENTEPTEYRRDSGCYNFDTAYQGRGGFYESEADSWSPHNKYNRRQSQGFQTLQDLINTSKAEDIPFTADDFPSLSKDPAESRLPRNEKSWASGWGKQEVPTEQVQAVTRPVAQVETNPGISFQWLETDQLANAIDVEPMPGMIQSIPEGRPVPIFSQFIEHLSIPEHFHLPLFTPPEPSFFSQSVATWNSREIRAGI